jgi:hypothetical protein
MEEEPIRRVPRDSERLHTLLGRHRQFWQGRRGDGFLRSSRFYQPSLPVSLPQPDGRRVAHAERVTPDLIDPASLIAEAELWDPDAPDAVARASAQYFFYLGRGDAPPLVCAYSKIPWLEAMLGCPITMTEGQIWNEHYAGDPQEVIEAGSHFDHNPWYQLYLEFLRQMPRRMGQRFWPSANTLLRGASDLVAAVMGVQEACIGWIEQPALMARLMRVCTDAILTTIEGGYRVLGDAGDGYVASWGVWAPASIIETQADHSTLLSARMYERQIMPFDLEVAGCCPHSIFHLHNCGLHVAPLLASAPQVGAVEVYLDPYPQGERKTWEVEMLQRIQEQKPLILDVNAPTYAECEWLLSQLDRRGLSFNARYALEAAGDLPAHLPGDENWILE